MKYQDYKNSTLKDSNFRRVWEDNGTLSEVVATNIEDARIRAGLTQLELAKLVGTKQPSIARLEKGTLLPSLSFLERIANALKTRLIPPTFELIVKVPTLDVDIDARISKNSSILLAPYYLSTFTDSGHLNYIMERTI